jgi:hypothetical protein
LISTMRFLANSDARECSARVVSEKVGGGRLGLRRGRLSLRYHFTSIRL